MSKSSNIRRNIGLLFVFVACVALVCADLVVSSAHSRQPQNTNSSTTQDDETTRGGMMTSNSNMSGNMSGNANKGRSSRRRGRRNRPANTNMAGGEASNANMSGDSGGQDANANMSGDTSGNANMSGDVMTGNANMKAGRRGRRRGRRGMNANTGGVDTRRELVAVVNNDTGGTQTDLSGTYTGTVNYPEGGLNGPATIVVTGNQFTLTPDGGGTPVNGTVTAVTTRGYTGVTMMFGDRTQIPASQSPPPLPAVSLRARMSGGRVTLMNVPGEKREFSFAATSASGTGRVKMRSKRRMSNRRRAMKGDTDRGMGSGETIKPPTKTP